MTTRKLPKKPQGRPVKYTGEHPDQRPCPPWCWHVTDNPDGHLHDDTDVDPRHLFEVDHTTHGFYRVPASRYAAEISRSDDGRTVRPATIELYLRQRGQREPRIDIGLRRFVWVQGEGTQQKLDVKRLKLSIEDVHELAAMLEHVIGLSELPALEEAPVARLA